MRGTWGQSTPSIYPVTLTPQMHPSPHRSPRPVPTSPSSFTRLPYTSPPILAPDSLSDPAASPQHWDLSGGSEPAE